MKPQGDDILLNEEREMKILNTLTASAVAAIISTAVWAQESDQNMDPASMIMHGYMQNGPAMNPQQMDWMRQGSITWAS